MKKFLLSAIAMVVAFAANAATAVETTTFKGMIAVGLTEDIPEIDEDSDPATVVFSKMDDGTYQFVLEQFKFGADLLIGDVTITNGLKAEEKDGALVLTADKAEAPITNSPGAAALGGKVLITMKATIKDGKMVAELSNIHVFLDKGMDVTAKFESTSSATGINSVSTASAKASRIYDLSGRELPAMQNGLNIVKMANGKTVKVIK